MAIHHYGQRVPMNIRRPAGSVLAQVRSEKPSIVRSILLIIMDDFHNFLLKRFTGSTGNKGCQQTRFSEFVSALPGLQSGAIVVARLPSAGDRALPFCSKMVSPGAAARFKACRYNHQPFIYQRSILQAILLRDRLNGDTQEKRRIQRGTCRCSIPAASDQQDQIRQRPGFTCSRIYYGLVAAGITSPRKPVNSGIIAPVHLQR